MPTCPGADLSGADLTRADLSGADLRGADLSFATLQGASLRGADLEDAELYCTTMPDGEVRYCAWDRFLNEDGPEARTLFADGHR